MKIRVKRIDPSLPLARRETAGAAGFDLVTRLDTVIAPGEIGLVPANIVVSLPAGYMLVVAARSSTPRRTGLIAPHGIGVIDSDYCGEQDEIMVQVWNPTASAVTVKRGERIAQALLVKTYPVEWVELAEAQGPTRGGFGSTG